MSFDDLGINHDLTKALARQDIEVLFSIQVAAETAGVEPRIRISWRSTQCPGVVWPAKRMATNQQDAAEFH